MKQTLNSGGHDILLADIATPAPAFQTVFGQYYAALCYYAGRITGSNDDAEDIVSHVFVKLWERKEPLRDLHHLQSFLYKTTRNACLDQLRKTEHEKERQLAYLQESEHFGSSETQELIRVEVLRSIYLEIKQLPPQCSKIITMSFVEGRKNDEIARELGLSEQTVKNQKSRGLSLLRMRLSGEAFALLLLLLAQGGL